MAESEPEATPDERQPRRRGSLSPVHRGIRYLALGCLVLLIGFAGGILAERDVFNPLDSHGFPTLDTVHALVDGNYYYRPASGTPTATFEQNLQYNAISGMMGGLDDYSRFLPPQQATAAANQLAGQYSGIGINANFANGAITVISPMIGQPADRAGVQAGDVIVAVDGHNLAKLSEDQALGMIKGPPGSKVRLTINRPDEKQPLDVPVTRALIDVPVVNYRFFPATKTAWIQIVVFGDKTTAQLDEALGKATHDGATGIVLDLRHNGGGWVTAAQEVIGRFLPASTGPAFWEDQTPGSSAAQSLPIVNGATKVFSTPLVVLVDGGTASASEIVTGALEDYGRATVVGEKSFGKGSVQKVFDLTDGSSVRITFAEWLTAKQHRIQGTGIQPAVVVKAGKGTGPSGDAQIDAAIVVLQKGGESIAPPASPVATPAPSPSPTSRQILPDAPVIGVEPSIVPPWA